MKSSRFVPIVLAIGVIAIVVGLTFWTIESPAIMTVESQSQLQTSIFQVSKTTTGYNITDTSGTYFFKFGLDYSENITQGSAVEIAVYCVLVKENIASGFTKGVALQLDFASLALNGSVLSSAASSKKQGDVQGYYFQISSVEYSPGNYSLEAKLEVSTIDINYIGNSLGNTQPVALYGNMSITS